MTRYSECEVPVGKYRNNTRPMTYRLLIQTRSYHGPCQFSCKCIFVTFYLPWLKLEAQQREENQRQRHGLPPPFPSRQLHFQMRRLDWRHCQRNYYQRTESNFMTTDMNGRKIKFCESVLLFYNITITILDIIHRPVFNRRFGDSSVTIFRWNLLSWA
jgi:hypothetical protein